MKINNLLKKNWALVLLMFAYLVIYFGQDFIGSYLQKETFQNTFGQALNRGWEGLVDYLSAHVLFCLIPAFFIAGAVNTLVSPSVILRYLGAHSKKWLAYLIASMSGFLVQVCSCTILPLFAGIWKRGAGLGVATTFLYAGPAVNLLALILTGQRIGWEFAFFRFALSMIFAVTVGLIMAFVFKNGREDTGELVIQGSDSALKGKKATWFWTTLLAILVIGTAPIDEQIKTVTVSLLVIAQLAMAKFWLSAEKRSGWWQETMKFFNQIIPLLLAGVFLASFITYLIPEEQFRTLTSQNNLLTNFAAVMFGALAYFPALVEVPIAENFMRMGMNKGPLMAYMLSDPVLSLQGLLVIRQVIGTRKMLVYAGSVIVLTTLAGYVYGLFA
jgi:uncharacterized protein